MDKIEPKGKLRILHFKLDQKSDVAIYIDIFLIDEIKTYRKSSENH